MHTRTNTHLYYHMKVVGIFHCLLKMLTEENLLAIECKHVSQAVSVLTFGSFTLYNYNFTIVSFLDGISTDN